MSGFVGSPPAKNLRPGASESTRRYRNSDPECDGLAVGQGAGGWLASKVAVSWGPKVVRIILLVAVMASALKLTGAIDFMIGLF